MTMRKLATNFQPVGKLLRWAALLVAISFVTGCVYYAAPVKPPLGGIFTEIKAPLTTDYNGSPTGASMMKASKSNTRYLYIPFLYTSSFGWDDVAIGKIAREGGIKDVSYADYELFSVLGVYAEFTVNVYGN